MINTTGRQLIERQLRPAIEPIITSDAHTPYQVTAPLSPGGARA